MKVSELKPPARGYFLITPDDVRYSDEPLQPAMLLKLVHEPEILELGAAGVLAINWQRGPARLPYNNVATQYRRMHTPQAITGGAVYGNAVLAMRIAKPRGISLEQVRFLTDDVIVEIRKRVRPENRGAWSDDKVIEFARAVEAVALEHAGEAAR